MFPTIHIILLGKNRQEEENGWNKIEELQFINLPNQCEIKIYTLAGDLLETIYHDDPTKGYEDWNLTSSVGQAVSSGIYLYTVQDTATGEVQVDKFVIIK